MGNFMDGSLESHMLAEDAIISCFNHIKARRHADKKRNELVAV